MVNLAYLLYKCATNNQGLEFGPHKFLENGEQPYLDEDIEEMYFEAVHWLRLTLSKEPNVADAYYLLGLFYEQGLSIDQNHELAFKYYQKAAEAGHVKSMTKLGHLYYSGIRKAEFMEEEVLDYCSISPMSGQTDHFMFAVMPDKMEAAKYYY